MVVTGSDRLKLLYHEITPKPLRNYLVIGYRGSVSSSFCYTNMTKPNIRDEVHQIKVFLPSYRFVYRLDVNKTNKYIRVVKVRL